MVGHWTGLRTAYIRHMQSWRQALGPAAKPLPPAHTLPGTPSLAASPIPSPAPLPSLAGPHSRPQQFQSTGHWGNPGWGTGPACLPFPSPACLHTHTPGPSQPVVRVDGAGEQGLAGGEEDGVDREVHDGLRATPCKCAGHWSRASACKRSKRQACPGLGPVGWPAMHVSMDTPRMACAHAVLSVRHQSVGRTCFV